MLNVMSLVVTVAGWGMVRTEIIAVGLGDEPDLPNITLKSSIPEGNPGKSFTISRRDAELSGLLDNILAADKREYSPSLKVPEAVLEEIAEYLKHHGGQIPGLKKPFWGSMDLRGIVEDPWDAAFIDKTLPDVIEVAYYTHYMDIGPLLQLCVAKIGTLLQGKYTMGTLLQLKKQMASAPPTSSLETTPSFLKTWANKLFAEEEDMLSALAENPAVPAVIFRMVLDFLPGRRYLFSSCANIIKQWDVTVPDQNTKLVRSVEVLSPARYSDRSLAVTVKNLAVAGDWLFAAGRVRRSEWLIQQYRVAEDGIDQKPVRTLLSATNGKEPPLAVAGDWLFSGGDNGTVLQWRVTDTGTKPVRTLQAHTEVRSLAVAGNWLFAGGADGTILQWPVREDEDAEPVRTLTASPLVHLWWQTHAVSALAVAGGWLFSGSGSLIQQWDVAKGGATTPERTLKSDRVAGDRLVGAGHWLFAAGAAGNPTAKSRGGHWLFAAGAAGNPTLQYRVEQWHVAPRSGATVLERTVDVPVKGHMVLRRRGPSSGDGAAWHHVMGPFVASGDWLFVGGSTQATAIQKMADIDVDDAIQKWHVAEDTNSTPVQTLRGSTWSRRQGFVDDLGQDSVSALVLG